MLEEMGKAARAAAWAMADLSAVEKNQVLLTIADRLEAESEIILTANEQDLAEARQNGMSAALLDRLTLTPARLSAIANDVRQVCQLADPVGQVIDGGQLDSGLRIERRRVPLGVIGVIYEASKRYRGRRQPVPENRQRRDSARRERNVAHQCSDGAGDSDCPSAARFTGGGDSGDRKSGS